MTVIDYSLTDDLVLNTLKSHFSFPQKVESESESDDDDDTRHGRGKFTSERIGVISLTGAVKRQSIPETLGIYIFQMIKSIENKCTIL